MKAPKWIIMVLVAMLCSCHNRTQNPENAGSANTEERTSERLDETCITYATEYDTVRHAKLKYFDFDGIDDLTGYFHTLAAEYPLRTGMAKSAMSTRRRWSALLRLMLTARASVAFTPTA